MPEFLKTLPEAQQNIVGTNKNGNGSGNNAGKRFVRRARRWAEIQQRRQFNRVLRPVNEQQMLQDSSASSSSSSSASSSPPTRYDFVELAAMGSGMWVVDEDQNACLVPVSGEQPAVDGGSSRSYPCTVLHPRRKEAPQQPHFTNQHNNRRRDKCSRGYRQGGDGPVYYTQAFNEFGQPTYISVYQTPPELTVYPRGPPMQTSMHMQMPMEAGKDVDKMLSLVTADLSVASLSSSSSNSSPLSTSVSSQENDDAFVFAHNGGYVPFNPTPRFFNPLQSHIFSPSPDFYVNTAPPPERSWVMLRHADPDRPIATFTVLCYNVLCDKYATVNQYSYCPSWALNWEYRKLSIMKEIRNYEADIITLQEVETEQYKMLFLPELKKLGYSGTFSPKSRAKTMNEEDRKYVDGCAIFWKADKFDLERQHTIEFTQLAMKRGSMSENMLNRVMPRDNIALCAVLKIKESVYTNRRVTIPALDNVVGNPLVVCTAHIHWDPEFCDVKLVQTMMLAHEVSQLLDEVSKHFNIKTQQCPLLICGDLNSLPDSGVFEYLSRGNISRRHMDLKLFREDVCLDKFSTSHDRNIIQHPLRLDSAVDPASIPFTNFTLEFKGMIDYIFSTPQSLARLGVLGTFDTNWVSNNKIIGFPHPHVPSDHIPIMAQYAIIPTTHQRLPPPPQALVTSSTMTSATAGVIGGGMPSSGQHSFVR